MLEVPARRSILHAYDILPFYTPKLIWVASYYIPQLDLSPISGFPSIEVEALTIIFAASKNGTIPQPQLVFVGIVAKRNPIPQLDLRPIACSPSVEMHSLPWAFQRNNHTQSPSTIFMIIVNYSRFSLWIRFGFK